MLLSHIPSFFRREISAVILLAVIVEEGAKSKVVETTNKYPCTRLPI